tara:strand:- start:280 stop:759 length:480 start_codon:yes stop_codon:yes gene_type:complete
MSRLRDIVESMAKTLRDSTFIQTSPAIPVIEEDSKVVVDEINKASGRSQGCFILVAFESASTTNQSPGPDLEECTFTVQVIEMPSIWRSKQRFASCTQIAEACARLLHHHPPADSSGNWLANGVLSLESMEQSSDDSSLIQTLTFNLPTVLDPTAPTRT